MTVTGAQAVAIPAARRALRRPRSRLRFPRGVSPRLMIVFQRDVEWRRYAGWAALVRLRAAVARSRRRALSLPSCRQRQLGLPVLLSAQPLRGERGSIASCLTLRAFRLLLEAQSLSACRRGQQMGAALRINIVLPLRFRYVPTSRWW